MEKNKSQRGNTTNTLNMYKNIFLKTSTADSITFEHKLSFGLSMSFRFVLFSYSQPIDLQTTARHRFSFISITAVPSSLRFNEKGMKEIPWSTSLVKGVNVLLDVSSCFNSVVPACRAVYITETAIFEPAFISEACSRCTQAHTAEPQWAPRGGR